MNLTVIHKFFEQIGKIIEKEMYQCYPADIKYHPSQGWKMHLSWFDGSIEAYIELQGGEYKISVESYADNSADREYSSEMQADRGQDPFKNIDYPMPKSKNVKLQHERSFSLKATTKDVARFLIDCQKSAKRKL